MTRPFVDVVIACHDERRPIERAVASLIHDDDVRDVVRVTVVAHGLDAGILERRLAGIDGDIRVLPFQDGIRSAAGPFNHGLAAVDAEYSGVMGSDDFLEPGTMSQWVRYVRAERPDAAIAQIRLQGQGLMPNPLVRLGRHRRLDAARDRLFYRTAPLGLFRTARVRELGLRMLEGVRVGEDFEFGIRLWAQGGRIDLLRGAGTYVIGEDAAERTTLGAMTVTERLAPIVRLFEDGVFADLSARARTALAVKLIRVTIVGNAQALAEELDDDDVAAFSTLLHRLLDVAPRALLPFNRQDRRILDGLLAEPRAARLRSDVASSRGAGRRDRWLTPDLVHSFARESTLRRYVLYFCKRERRRTR
ncbi:MULTISPECIES: glycosyltransferase [unclassified Microbacterium]|uniref:glycosyltransferase n=1 Tax=unclassified Microbacterium TaxID=2609290 RepID=UPI001604B326|nr:MULTISPECIES: glycosyltransferase [unclassified Microbacterium]QNA92275.1 glycosyltransferase family 2 protein [Microbacterium sp. Se63.02b]QYM65545.1 glycosyltransferase family 2 protein [Microbacterium sp. Se5.02b]